MNYRTSLAVELLTLVLSFGFFFRFFVDLFRKFPTDVAEIRHLDTRILQTLLGFLELVIRELEPAQQVPDTIGHTTTSE